MPQEVIHKSYPKANYGLNGQYRDNIEGLDAFGKENNSRLSKQVRKPSDA